jgi:arylsulfatase A-like enzyme
LKPENFTKLMGLLAVTLVLVACKEDPKTVPSPATQTNSPATIPGPRPPLAPATSAAHTAHIVLVSLDGGRPDFLQRAQMPTLHAMAREGATTWAARSIVPPLTLPAHSSMLSGLAPEVHQVYWNMWIPAFGPLRFPTVFMLAKSNGLSAAMFSAKDKLGYLFPPGSADVISYPVPDPRDYYGTNVFSAGKVAEQAVKYFTQHRPRLLFVHLSDGDIAGHYYGWPSPEQYAAFAECDIALKTLRTGIAQAGGTNAIFLITADHGGAGLSHGVDRPEDMTIPWIAWGSGVKRGHSLIQPISLPDTAATIAWLLGFKLPPNTIGQPVREAFE